MLIEGTEEADHILEIARLWVFCDYLLENSASKTGLQIIPQIITKIKDDI